MNTRNLSVKILFLILVLVFNTQAQVTSSNSDLRDIQSETNDVRISQIISNADKYFKQGELSIQDNKLPQAWEYFDKSVEVIWLSAVNVRRNPKLNDYYLQLIERIYKTELTVKKKSVQNKEIKFEISPKCIESELKKETTVSKYLVQAVNLYKKGGNDEAASKLRLVLVDEPMSVTAYLLLGKIHFRRDDKEQAISSLKTSLFWDNRSIEAHILLGKIYFEKGDILQARNYSASALAINSDNNRAQALSRLVEGRASNEDKRTIEDDSSEIEKLLQELGEEIGSGKKKYSDVVFVAPFQGSDDNDLLNTDFAYVLSEILIAPNLCVVKNEEREKLTENFGFDADETFTLATAIKFAIASKSNLLVVGKYTKTFDSIGTTAKIINVNEGRFLSEELADGRTITRLIHLSDSPSNLRALQGQIAYQILYQHNKELLYSQNGIIERATKIKLPNSLNFDGNSTNEPDFSINNSLRKTTCNDNVLETLQIRNFRLGITFDDAAKILPKATVKNTNSYEKQMSQNFSTTVLKDVRFKDISSIQLQFFDNRLHSIEIVYGDNINWQNLNEFALQVEKSLNLPTMKKGGYEFDGNYLYCGNYQIKVMFANYKTPAIHLFDTTIFDKIKQRKQEEKNKALQQKIEEEKRKKQIEEEKKKVFKP